MPEPITYKPWIDGRGQPVAVPDPSGHFVLKTDYDTLAKRFYASNRAIAQLEATPTTEDDHGPDAA